jgi:hypothetical protein
MDLQLTIVIFLLAAAGLYLCRATWQAITGAKIGCRGGNCSARCSEPRAEKPLIPSEDLILRLKDR